MATNVYDVNGCVNRLSGSANVFGFQPVPQPVVVDIFFKI